MDADEEAPGAVVLDQLVGDAHGFHAPVDDLWSVVVAALLEGAFEQPLLGEVVGELEVEDYGELALRLGEDLVERLGLGQSAREALEDEAVHGVRLDETLPHDLDRQVV